MATIEAAGQAHVPYTSGLLIGIGETWLERLQALLALHSLHCKYGHIQVYIGFPVNLGIRDLHRLA